MKLGGAFILINKELSDALLVEIKAKLYITSTITINQYQTIINNSNNASDQIAYMKEFTDSIHNNNNRLLLVYNDFQQTPGKEFADIVIFYSHGLLNIQKNNFGPPSQSIPLTSLSIHKLFNYFNLAETNTKSKPVISPYDDKNYSEEIEEPENPDIPSPVED